MTVKELIKHLKTMPQDALVITSYWSDYKEIEKEDIELRKDVIRHNGHLMSLNPSWWPEDLKDPVYLNVVYFKGN